MNKFIKKQAARVKRHITAVREDSRIAEHTRGFEWAAALLVEHGPFHVVKILDQIHDCDEPFDRGAKAAIGSFQELILEERTAAVKEYKACIMAEVDRWADMHSLPARMIE